MNNLRIITLILLSIFSSSQFATGTPRGSYPSLVEVAGPSDREIIAKITGDELSDVFFKKSAVDSMTADKFYCVSVRNFEGVRSLDEYPIDLDQVNRINDYKIESLKHEKNIASKVIMGTGALHLVALATHLGPIGIATTSMIGAIEVGHLGLIQLDIHNHSQLKLELDSVLSRNYKSDVRQLGKSKIKILQKHIGAVPEAKYSAHISCDQV